MRSTTVNSTYRYDDHCFESSGLDITRSQLRGEPKVSSADPALPIQSISRCIKAGFGSNFIVVKVPASLALVALGSVT